MFILAIYKRLLTWLHTIYIRLFTSNKTRKSSTSSGNTTSDKVDAHSSHKMQQALQNHEFDRRYTIAKTVDRQTIIELIEAIEGTLNETILYEHMLSKACVITINKTVLEHMLDYFRSLQIVDLLLSLKEIELLLNSNTGTENDCFDMKIIERYRTRGQIPGFLEAFQGFCNDEVSISQLHDITRKYYKTLRISDEVDVGTNLCNPEAINLNELVEDNLKAICKTYKTYYRKINPTFKVTTDLISKIKQLPNTLSSFKARIKTLPVGSRIHKESLYYAKWLRDIFIVMKKITKEVHNHLYDNIETTGVEFDKKDIQANLLLIPNRIDMVLNSLPGLPLQLRDKISTSQQNNTEFTR